MINFQRLAEHVLSKSDSNVSSFIPLRMETRNLSLPNGNLKRNQVDLHIPEKEGNQAVFKETTEETTRKLIRNGLDTKGHENGYESFLASSMLSSLHIRKGWIP